MASLTAPSSSAFNAVTVNVKLCGSVPREEIQSLSSDPTFSSRTPHTNSYFAGRDGDSSSSQLMVIEDEDTMASQLCSQLSHVGQQQQHQSMSSSCRPSGPQFEAPTWAVPAVGESRLEVSIEKPFANALLSFVEMNH